MTNRVTFVAPPGWPSVSAGRLPAAEWTPSATLPPAPPGWVFYRDHTGAPVPPPPGSWTPPVAPSAATQIPVIPASVRPAPAAGPATAPLEDAPPHAPASAAWAPPGGPSTTPPTTQATSRSPRLLLVVGAIALAVMLSLGVGGYTVYNMFFSAPQLTAAQFDRLESVRTYGGQPTTFSQSAPIGLTWLGAEEGDLPECQKVADFDNEHLLSVYRASTNPNGGMDGEVVFRLFGNTSELSTYQRLWAECDAATVTAKIYDVGAKPGSTAGVAWLRDNESTIFWYGNVAVFSMKPLGSDAGAAVEANAIKAVIDSLR